MTTNFPTVMDTTTLADALQQSQVQETSANAGVSFLRMDFETGEWTLGRDGDDVTGDEVLVNTPSIKHGWVLWSGGSPKKVFVPFTAPLPPEIPPVGDDYPSEARSFEGAMTDDGEMVGFDTNSYGGRKGVDILLGQIKAHAAEGSTFLYPRVKLSSESYQNKKRGGKLVYNPVFEIVAWCNEDNETETAAPAVEDKTEEKAEAPQAEEAAPEETSDEKPTRRRRRRRNAG